jgi:hypothetical protein
MSPPNDIMNLHNSSIKPPLKRNLPYTSVQANSVSRSNTDKVIGDMRITINGTEYGLYKVHTPTRRNGGKRHGKKRRTRKN